MTADPLVPGLERVRARLLDVADGYGLWSRLLGFVLLATAYLKTEALATTEVVRVGPWTSRWTLLALIELELAFGLWLIAGLYRRITRFVALLVFAALLHVSLNEALAGAASCGCVGRLRLSPWLVAAFDFIAVAGLIFFAPRQAASPPALVAWRGAAYVIVFLPMAALTGIALVDYGPRGVMPSLRFDPYLRERYDMEAPRPTTGAVLGRLSELTGLTLTVDESLPSGDWPGASGPLRLENVHAWAVMELVANRQGAPARWDRKGGGYHLAAAAPVWVRVVPWLVGPVVLIGALKIGCAGGRKLARPGEEQVCPEHEVE